MMGISGSRLLVISALGLLAIDPKDLPNALRTLGRAVGRRWRMAWEFQRRLDDMGRAVERAADAAPRPKPDDPASRAAPAETAPLPPSAKDAP